MAFCYKLKDKDFYIFIHYVCNQKQQNFVSLLSWILQLGFYNNIFTLQTIKVHEHLNTWTPKCQNQYKQNTTSFLEHFILGIGIYIFFFFKAFSMLLINHKHTEVEEMLYEKQFLMLKKMSAMKKLYNWL